LDRLVIPFELLKGAGGEAIARSDVIELNRAKAILADAPFSLSSMPERI
jgi:hypothetical protein